VNGGSLISEGSKNCFYTNDRDTITSYLHEDLQCRIKYGRNLNQLYQHRLMPSFRVRGASFSDPLVFTRDKINRSCNLHSYFLIARSCPLLTELIRGGSTPPCLKFYRSSPSFLNFGLFFVLMLSEYFVHSCVGSDYYVISLTMYQ